MNNDFYIIEISGSEKSTAIQRQYLKSFPTGLAMNKLMRNMLKVPENVHIGQPLTMNRNVSDFSL